jgi:outer membrane protein assembly factor BamB
MQEAMKITDEVQFLDAVNLKIARNSFEELTIELPDGTTHTNVEAVRSFPLTDSNKYITLLDSEGKEIGIVRDIKQLPRESAETLLSELQKRYFMPKITKIYELDGEFGVTRWVVETNRGPVTFSMRTRYDVVSLENGRVLIKDADGNRYEIENYHHLDPDSIVLLETQL